MGAVCTLGGRAAVAGGVPCDSFNRANGPLVGSTTSSGGRVWELLPVGTSVTPRVSGNQLTAPTDNGSGDTYGWAAVESGVSDGMLSIDVVSTVGSSNWGFIYRYIDTSNFGEVRYNAFDSSIYIIEVVGGVTTLSVQLPGRPDDGTSLTFTMRGTSLTAAWTSGGAGKTLSATATGLTAGTKHGVSIRHRSGFTDPTFDNWCVLRYYTNYMAPTYQWVGIPIYPTTNPSTTGYVDNFSRPSWLILGRTGAGVGAGMPGIIATAYDAAGNQLYSAGSGADPGHDFFWIPNASLASTAVPVAGWKIVKSADSSLIASWGWVPPDISDPLTGSGALVGSHATTGQTWVSLFSNGNPLQRSSQGAGYNPAGAISQEYATIATANVRVDMTARFFFTDPATQCELIFRTSTNISDTWLVMKSNISNTYILRKNIGGTGTDLFTGGSPVTGDTIRVTDTGSVVTLYVNGVQLAQVTDSTYNTNTKIGIGAYASGSGISSSVRDFSAIVG